MKAIILCIMLILVGQETVSLPGIQVTSPSSVFLAQQSGEMQTSQLAKFRVAYRGLPGRRDGAGSR